MIRMGHLLQEWRGKDGDEDGGERDELLLLTTEQSLR
jgi:hypothetical protein